MTTATAEAPAPTFVRTSTDLDLNRLASEMRKERGDVLRVDVPMHDVEFHLDADEPTIKLGNRELPATEGTKQAFGDLLDVPKAFLKRLDKSVPSKVTNDMLDALFTGYGGSQGLTFHLANQGEGGVMGIYTPGKEPLDPTRLVEVAGRVLGDTASPVERLVNTRSEFSLDVRVPETSKVGVGGDFKTKRDGTKVGDITAGGIRLGVNLKQNLAPWVEPWTYRLWCTNGMGHTDTGLRIDARGQSWEETLAEFEQVAERAFSRVEEQIEHFYNLREQRVKNPERALRAIAREQGLPARSVNAMMDLIPTEVPENATMFDVVNLVTNFANSPSVINDGGRLLLERAGGNVVSEEARRCNRCNQKVH